MGVVRLMVPIWNLRTPFQVIQTEDVKVALNGVTQATTKYAVDNVSNPTKIDF